VARFSSLDAILSEVPFATVRIQRERSLAAGQAAATTREKAKALEDLICYVFECIPGISVTQRNTFDVFQAEEVDVAFWNDQHHQGMWFLPTVLLVECKNWSVPVSNDEVVFFDEKLRRRGLSFGILVAAKGITGDHARRTAAHATIARALAEQRQLIILTVDEKLGRGACWNQL
jgi:hypothetical protein